MEFTESQLKRQLSVVEELEAQSDRGAAIVGAAWLEEDLLGAIKAKVKFDKKAWSRLFDGSGPLANFASKIDLARLLGIISRDVHIDLHVIRSVRNEFAHAVLGESDEALNFGSPSINDRCIGLKSIAHERHSVPRNAYIRACAVLNADFHLYQRYSQGRIHTYHELPEDDG